MSSRCQIQDLTDHFMKAGLLIEMTVSRMSTGASGDSIRKEMVSVFMSEYDTIARGGLFSSVDGIEAVNEPYLLFLLKLVVARLNQLDEQDDDEEQYEDEDG